MRYRQILPIITKLKPDTVLEIGTHKAQRPREWYGVHKFKMYYGFDIFEDGTEELNRKEMNGKGMCSYDLAEERLKGIPHKLTKGNTKETLKDFNEKIDFAFIDGGHSIETIQSDWDNVKRLMSPGGIVIFDDYYQPVRKGFGCNEVIADLQHTILPEGNGGVYLVKVICD